MRGCHDGVVPVPAGAAHRIREHAPCVVDARHGWAGWGSNVRMMLLGQAPIGARDLLARCIAGNAQNGVRVELAHDTASLRRDPCYPVARDHEARGEPGTGRAGGSEFDHSSSSRRCCRGCHRAIRRRCADRWRPTGCCDSPCAASVPEPDGRPRPDGRGAGRRVRSGAARRGGPRSTPHGRRAIHRARSRRGSDVDFDRPSLAHRSRGWLTGRHSDGVVAGAGTSACRR